MNGGTHEHSIHSDPFARITGRTVIGEDCRIGACAILHDAVLEDGAEVFAFSMISSSKLGENAHAGPYARLRMGAELGESAHVGNFVELKNTRFGGWIEVHASGLSG